MIISIVGTKDFIEFDIPDDTIDSILEFTHLERAEFRLRIAENVPIIVKQIIDNPHFKGM